MSRFVGALIRFVVDGRFLCLLSTTFLTCSVVVSANAADRLTIWVIANEARTGPDSNAVPDSAHLNALFSQWERVGINLSVNRSKALQDFDYAKTLFGQRTFLNLLAEYRSKHGRAPEFSIRFFGWDDYFEKLKQVSKNESAPDIVQVPSTWCSSLAEDFNVLAPVPEERNDVFARFPKQVKAACRPVGDQQFYGIPWLLDVRVLFFWRDIFPTLDRDLDESIDKRNTFEAALEAAQRHSNIVPFGLPTARDWELLHQTAMLVWGEHGQLIRPRRELVFFTSHQPVFQQAALRGALYIRSLARRGMMDLPRQDRYYLETEFLNHQRGSILSGPWLLKFLQERLGSSFGRQIGIALPPFGDNTDFSFLGGSFLALTRVAEKRRRTTEAVDLISYLATSYAAAQYARSTGLIPADAGAVNEHGAASSVASGTPPSYTGVLYSLTSDPNAAQTLATAIDRGCSYPAISQWWRLEAPAELSALYLLWQDIATNQSDWDLDTDLRQLAQSWDKELRVLPEWAAWGAGATSCLIGVGIGVWWSVRRSFRLLRVAKSALEAAHLRDLTAIKELQEKLDAVRSGEPAHPTPLPHITITITSKSLEGSANGVHSSLKGREFKIFSSLLRECALRSSPVRFTAVWALIRLWAVAGRPASPNDQLQSIVTEFRNFFRRLDPRLADHYLSSEHGIYELKPDDHIHVVIETAGQRIPFVDAVRNPYTEALVDMKEGRYEVAFERLAEAFKVEERLDWPDILVLIAMLDCYTHLDTPACTHKRVLERARDALQKVFDHYSRAIANYGHDIVKYTAVGAAATEMIAADWEAVLTVEKKIRSALEGTPFDIFRLPPEIAGIWETVSDPHLRAKLSRHQIEEHEKEIWEHFTITHAATVFGPVRETLQKLGHPTERLKLALARRLSELNKTNYELVLNGSAPRELINSHMVTIYDYLAEALKHKLVEDLRSSLLAGARSHVLIEIAAGGDDEIALGIGDDLRTSLNQGAFPASLEHLVDVFISSKQPI